MLKVDDVCVVVADNADISHDLKLGSIVLIDSLFVTEPYEAEVFYTKGDTQLMLFSELKKIGTL